MVETWYCPNEQCSQKKVGEGERCPQCGQFSKPFDISGAAELLRRKDGDRRELKKPVDFTVRKKLQNIYLDSSVEVTFEEASNLAIKTIIYNIPIFIIGYIILLFSLSIGGLAMLIFSLVGVVFLSLGSLIILYKFIIPELIEGAIEHQNQQIKKVIDERVGVKQNG
jgi:hypothetical protein